VTPKRRLRDALKTMLDVLIGSIESSTSLEWAVTAVQLLIMVQFEQQYIKLYPSPFK
jgi:hypothetical protein